MKPKERIVGAAIQYDGLTFSLPKPARHGEVMLCAHEFLGSDKLAHATQGFITSEGRFVNRIQGKQIAWVAKQKLLRDEAIKSRDLFSEDLW